LIVFVKEKSFVFYLYRMHNFALKFILVGDSRVGKSQLSRKFTKNQFNNDAQSTVGMEFSTRAIEFEKSLIKAQLWDTAGQERFESMTKAYYRDAVGAALIFDVCNRQSFLSLRNMWVRQVTNYGHESMRLILVGNKVDLIGNEHLREVPVSEALELARELNIDYIETSALTGLGVESMFRRLVLSVARLLPEIKVHLELTSLPEGWMIQFNEEMNGKNDRQVSSSAASEGRTTIELSSVNSSSITGSAHNSIPRVNPFLPEDSPSTGRPISMAAQRQSIADRARNDFINKYVYVNYWTGEKQSELPSKSACTGLLYTAGVVDKNANKGKGDIENDDFTRISLDERALTERSSSAKTLDLRTGNELDEKIRRCRCVVS
jgi:small GTP-binding protein